MLPEPSAPGRVRAVLRSVRSGLLAGLLAALPAHAAAQATGTVEGTVTAAGSGSPLAGVSVRLEGPAAHAAVTDARGAFRIAAAPGAYTLTASRVGLAARTRAVTVRAGAAERVALALEEASVLLPSVVVSTTREVQRLGETPVTVGVVSSRELRDARPTHPGEVMSQVPGVWVSVTGGEGHMTSIRQPRTTNPVYLFLEDGVPTRSTGFFNHNALYEVNVPQADRIEVLKGPATALYGSDAIGGVINVETRAPGAANGVEGYAEGGPHGWTRFLGSASGTVGGNGVRADLNLTRTDGWRDATDYDRQSATLRWDRTLGGGMSLRTVVAYSRIDQQTAGSSTLSEADYRERPTVNYTPISFRNVRAFRASVAFQRVTARTRLSITPFVRDNSMELLPNWALTFDPTVFTTGHSSVGVLAQYRVDFDAIRTRVIGGVDVDYSPGFREEDRIAPTRAGQFFTDYTTGDRVYDYDVTFRGVSPFVQAEVSPTDRLHVTGGIRFDAVGYAYDSKLDALQTGRWRRPADADVDYRHWSPKLGATYEVSPALTVYGSYAHGFRAPSEGQLFRQGQAANTIGLEPVKADSWEGGARGEIGGVVGWQVAAYRMEVEDDILAFVNPDGTRETVNAGRTLHRGVEAGLGVRLPAGFRVDAAYTRAKHTYEAWSPRDGVDYGGNGVEAAPRDLLNLRLGWSPAALPDLRLQAEWMRVGPYWMDAENVERYDGHDLLHLRANLPVTPRLEVIARLQNVLDERYAESASYTAARGVELAPGAPRSLYAGLQLRLGR